MYKIIIFAVAGYLLYKLFMGDKKKKMDKSSREKNERVDAGDMVKDPICGTYVSADSPIRVRDGKTVHRFCSYECRDAYLKKKDSEQGAS